MGAVWIPSPGTGGVGRGGECGVVIQSILKSLSKVWVSLGTLVSVRGQVYLHEQFMHQRVPFGENLPRSSPGILPCALTLSAVTLPAVALLMEWSLEDAAGKRGREVLRPFNLCVSGMCLALARGARLVAGKDVTCHLWSWKCVGLQQPKPWTLSVCGVPDGDVETSWQMWLPSTVRITFPACRWGPFQASETKLQH